VLATSNKQQATSTYHAFPSPYLILHERNLQGSEVGVYVLKKYMPRNNLENHQREAYDPFFIDERIFP
jgi:hypothetical protein